MSELIKVDFKSKEVISRQNLDVIPDTKWEATKDPDFKDWVSGIAMMAESCHALGGNWQQMVVIVHGKPEGENAFCMSMYDGTLITDQQVIDVLDLAKTRVFAQNIGESAEGNEDEPA